MMKKFVSRLLSLLLVCMLTLGACAWAESTAVNTSRGATLTMPISISGGGKNALIGIKTNGAPVTFASAVGGSVNDTVPPQSFSGSFVVVNLEGATISPDGSAISGALTAVADLAAGEVGTLTFTVNEDAAFGTYTVEAYLISGSTTVTGYVTFTVGDRLPGDANDDGDVTTRDAMLILQKIAGFEVTLNESNADCNADGDVTTRDAMLILQQIAGFEVTLQ